MKQTYRISLLERGDNRPRTISITETTKSSAIRRAIRHFAATRLKSRKNKNGVWETNEFKRVCSNFRVQAIEQVG